MGADRTHPSSELRDASFLPIYVQQAPGMPIWGSMHITGLGAVLPHSSQMPSQGTWNPGGPGLEAGLVATIHGTAPHYHFSLLGRSLTP